MSSYEDTKVFPEQQYIFRAFNYFDIEHLKVVVLGQDCYHSLSKNNIPLACGLSFSVDEKCKTLPPSLRVIFDEIHHEYGVKRTNTDLSDWAKQGVLMLNCALTVRQGKPNSHAKSWKPFTDDMIKHIAKHCQHVVYILWGEFAKGYSQYIDDTQNIILTCRHPSPLAQSKGPFVGNNHFKLANEYLQKNNKQTIAWV
jgi:uracil-DNA glycosylase